MSAVGGSFPPFYLSVNKTSYHHVLKTQQNGIYPEGSFTRPYYLLVLVAYSTFWWHSFSQNWFYLVDVVDSFISSFSSFETHDSTPLTTMVSHGSRSSSFRRRDRWRKDEFCFVAHVSVLWLSDPIGKFGPSVSKYRRRWLVDKCQQKSIAIFPYLFLSR